MKCIGGNEVLIGRYYTSIFLAEHLYSFYVSMTKYEDNVYFIEVAGMLNLGTGG